MIHVVISIGLIEGAQTVKDKYFCHTANELWSNNFCSVGTLSQLYQHTNIINVHMTTECYDVVISRYAIYPISVSETRVTKYDLFLCLEGAIITFW
jgi:hypothetical protein